MLAYTFLFLVVAFISYISVLWIKLVPYNQKPLKIRTFDKSDSPYHPSVLYIENGWNGYKYWMAETPFAPQGKPYRDRNECPSIHVSNDGINWSEITINPIDNLTEKEIEELDYFSDPHLVFADNKIECWYRFTHREGIKENFNNLQLARRTSEDGIHWSDREILANFSDRNVNPVGKLVVSPAILYHKNKYRMWFVNSESRIHREFSYSESTDGKNWTQERKCILKGRDNTPWHIDVNYIDGEYYLLSYDFKDLTIWKSRDGITFNYANKILEPSVTGSFYSEGLYRACIAKDTDFRIYFSSNDAQKTYIGLMSGKDINDLKVVSNGKHLTFWGLANYICKKKWISFKFITKRGIKHFKTNGSFI